MTNFNSEYYEALDPLQSFDITVQDLTHNIGIGLGLGMVRMELSKPIQQSEGQSIFWIRLNPTF